MIKRPTSKNVLLDHKIQHLEIFHTKKIPQKFPSKGIHNVKSAYVTLQNFTPDLQKIYTDISAVSVTLCNSDPP